MAIQSTNIYMKKLTFLFFTFFMVSIQMMTTYGQVEFQTLKGKQYSFEIQFPKSEYNYEQLSASQESWTSGDEPNAGIYAYKDNRFPGGQMGAATILSECRKAVKEDEIMTDYSEEKKEIPGGTKYEARFKVKTYDGQIQEYYLIIGILNGGDIDPDELVWAKAILVFSMESIENENIIETFFSSFELEK